MYLFLRIMYFKFLNGRPIAIEDLKLVFAVFVYPKSSICFKSSVKETYRLTRMFGLLTAIALFLGINSSGAVKACHWIITASQSLITFVHLNFYYFYSWKFSNIKISKCHLKESGVLLQKCFSKFSNLVYISCYWYGSKSCVFLLTKTFLWIRKQVVRWNHSVDTARSLYKYIKISRLLELALWSARNEKQNEKSYAVKMKTLQKT